MGYLDLRNCLICVVCVPIVASLDYLCLLLLVKIKHWHICIFVAIIGNPRPDVRVWMHVIGPFSQPLHVFVIEFVDCWLRSCLAPYRTNT